MILIQVVKPSFAPSINASNTFTFLYKAPPINAIIISNKSPLLNMLENTIISSLSSVETYQTRPAIRAVIPPIHEMKILFSNLNFCLIPTYKMAINVEQYVDIKSGINMSVGLAAPRIDLCAIMAMGIIVRPDVFSAKNII